MKKIGIIGGIGPESTMDYYKRIISSFQRQGINPEYPEIIIYSANMTELLRLIDANRWEDLAEWLLGKIEKLYRAGAEFAVIGSNTPHFVFGEVSLRSPIPLISIIEETCKKVEAMGCSRAGLMGTQFTMKSDFFQKEFAKKEISIITPDPEDQQLIHHKLFSEIELGIIKDTTRVELEAIIKKMKENYSIDSIILGCTELPLILTSESIFGIPLLNTTAIHVESILKLCLSNS